MSNGKILKIVKNTVNKPTWIIHGVIDEPNANGIVYHTHGMSMYDSLELELNLPIAEKDALVVLNEIGLNIANGKHLNENEKIYGILGSPFILRKMKSICDNDIEVLRVIVPDVEGNFPWDKNCKDIFNKQIS